MDLLFSVVIPNVGITFNFEPSFPNILTWNLEPETVKVRKSNSSQELSCTNTGQPSWKKESPSIFLTTICQDLLTGPSISDVWGTFPLSLGINARGILGNNNYWSIISNSYKKEVRKMHMFCVNSGSYFPNGQGLLALLIIYKSKISVVSRKMRITLLLINSIVK